jgi:outer membrane efflux protein
VESEDTIGKQTRGCPAGILDIEVPDYCATDKRQTDSAPAMTRHQMGPRQESTRTQWSTHFRAINHSGISGRCLTLLPRGPESQLVENDGTDLAEQAYRAGSITLTDVLDANRQLLVAQDELDANRADAARAAVGVFRALGGGWEQDHIATRHDGQRASSKTT